MVGRTISRITALLVTGFALSATLFAQTAWLSRGFEPGGTADNQTETVLNPSNVNSGQFGLLFTRPVDGQLYAQPLVATNVKVGKQKLNIVYLATEHDSVFAYDADNAGNAAPIWQRSFIDPANGVTTIPYYDLTGEMDIHPEVGITSTPVINAGASVIYVVVRTLEGDANVDANYHQRLYGLDLATGAIKLGPVELAAQVTGTGDGSSGGVVAYNGRRENQRPALVLSQGKLYIAAASHGDQTPYHGWILCYDATTLKFLSCFCSTPNGYDGGFWMGGAAMPVLGNGNIYAATGNGHFDSASSDFGDSLLRFDENLNLLDYFTPYNQANLDAWDSDFGSGGPILIPGTHMLVSGSKEGKLYLVNGYQMQKFNAANDNKIVQWWWACNSLIFGQPIFWNGGAGKQSLYIWSSFDVLKEFSFNGTTFNTTPVAQSAASSPGEPGGFLAVSSNGTDPTTAIVWSTSCYSGDANQNTVPGILRAFKATDLTELWNSRMVAPDDFGDFAKFNPPVVVNGKVYVPTFSNQLAVYGELPHVAPSVVGLSAEAGDGEVALTWVAARGASSYVVARGPVGGPFTTLATVSSGTFYDDKTAADGTSYGYVVTASNSYGASAASYEADATPQKITSTAAGTGLLGVYYNDPGDGTRFRTQALKRVDPQINFDWNSQSPNSKVTQVNFSVTWYGMIVAPTTGYYTFQTTTDDGGRLWVRNSMVINGWVDQAPTSYNSTPVLLVAGTPYPIQMEYYQDQGGAVASLSWQVPGSSSFTIVPKSALYPYPSSIPVADQPLDLTAQFNLDGISYLANPTDGNIGYLSQTYAADTIPTSSNFGIASSLYVFGPRYDQANNILQADGRTIPVPAYSAGDVQVVGAAINGTQTGTFVFNYSDGTSLSTPVSFTDWGASKALNKETRLAEFNHRNGPAGRVAVPTSLFRYSFSLNNKLRLISITVPNNTDMKILAISIIR